MNVIKKLKMLLSSTLHLEDADGSLILDENGYDRDNKYSDDIYFGAEQFCVSPLRNNGFENGNLEEQNLLGLNCITDEYSDTDKNYIIEKSFYNDEGIKPDKYYKTKTIQFKEPNAEIKINENNEEFIFSKSLDGIDYDENDEVLTIQSNTMTKFYAEDADLFVDVHKIIEQTTLSYGNQEIDNPIAINSTTIYYDRAKNATHTIKAVKYLKQ